MPPYSDNLYSGEDVDAMSDGGESFSDELSPSDGYFGRTEMPTARQTLVPDPTLDPDCYGPPEAKTLIDPPNSQPTSGSSSRQVRHHPRTPQVPLPSSPPHVSPRTMSPVPQVSSHSHRRLGSFSEQDPLITHAPPAYSESPPQSSASTSTRHTRSYSTFPEQQLERGFLTAIAGREPESMGGPVDGSPSESEPLLAGGGFSPHKRKFKVLVLAGILLAIVGSTLAIVFSCTDQSRGKPIDPNAEYCPAATSKNDETVYGFSGGRELSIIHKIKEPADSKIYSAVSAEGEIRLRRAPFNSTHGKDPYITVDIGTSTKMSTVLNWSEDSQTLELTTPRYADKYTTKAQCLYVIITAYFPEDIELTNLLFDSPTLNIALSDVKVNVTSRSKFSTASGHIWLTTADEEESRVIPQSSHPALCSKPEFKAKSMDEPDANIQFSSRRTVVETVSGQITGTYPLLDDLVLSSESGNINVAVSPQPASIKSPAPADLEVQTASGSIHVDLPISGQRQAIPGKTIPFRDYITRIHSTSGSLSGSYYIGSESNFKTTSGNVDIVTLPILPTDEGASKVPPNSFETHTVSGTTKISVLDPIIFTPVSLSPEEVKLPPLDIGGNDPYKALLPPVEAQAIDSAKLRSLRSAHSSNTGTITASYPDAWLGSVHVKTVSGDIEVKGEGFTTVTDRTGWAFKEVKKRRGVKGEGSVVDISNISGRVEFVLRPR